MTTVRDIDRGARRLTINVSRAGLIKTTVGIHAEEGGESAGDSDLTLAEVAAVHEFGAGNVPQRSFLRETIDMKRDEIARFDRQLGRRILRKPFLDPRRAMQLLGEFVAKLVRERIREGIEPENAEATIAQKGSSKPLVDTGQLIQSIRSEVK